jgi:hypothetical protein
VAPQAEPEFCLSSRKGYYFSQEKTKFQPLSSIEIYPGVRQFYPNVKITQKPGFGSI